MIASDLEALAQTHGLSLLGGFHTDARDMSHFPENTQSLLLFGPMLQHFWPLFIESPEWNDGDPDPMDRWSIRNISAMAQIVGGQALFPFGGPPFLPFYSWALQSGRAWESPVKLLVHDRQGLWLSYRGAIALPYRYDPPPPTKRPCESCADKPCLNACPTQALVLGHYDVPACRAFLKTDLGTGCLSQGCTVRRACSVTLSCARVEGHSAYHMGVFNR